MGHGRPEDQSLPVGNNLPHAHELAKNELDNRKTLGINRYGQPLQPANGRDAIQDAYDEALDGSAYLAQAKWEQDHPEYTYVGSLIEAIDNLGYVNFHGRFVPKAVTKILNDLDISWDAQ
jgi:hypothetical protein